VDQLPLDYLVLSPYLVLDCLEVSFSRLADLLLKHLELVAVVHKQVSGCHLDLQPCLLQPAILPIVNLNLHLADLLLPANLQMRITLMFCHHTQSLFLFSAAVNQSHQRFPVDKLLARLRLVRTNVGLSIRF